MKKKWLGGLLITVCLVFPFTWYCNHWVEHGAAPLVFNAVHQVPFHKAGLLLGTGKYLGDGKTMNPYFVHRIAATALLYKAGKIKVVIVSGDNSRKNYNEPEDMRLALMELGVPDSVIYLDFAGFRTNDSVIRCREIFGQRDITIISQQFHNERAVMIAAAYDIAAHGFNAAGVNGKAGLRTDVREYLARVKMFIDLKITHRQPKFLGQPVQIN